MIHGSREHHYYLISDPQSNKITRTSGLKPLKWMGRERERERERELASKGGSVPHVNGRRVYSIRACTASMPSEGQLRYSLGTVSIMSVRKHTQPSGTELLVPWSWSMRPELICA